MEPSSPERTTRASKSVEVDVGLDRRGESTREGSSSNYCGRYSGRADHHRLPYYLSR